MLQTTAASKRKLVNVLIGKKLQRGGVYVDKADRRLMGRSRVIKDIKSVIVKAGGSCPTQRTRRTKRKGIIEGELCTSRNVEVSRLRRAEITEDQLTCLNINRTGIVKEGVQM